MTFAGRYISCKHKLQANLGKRPRIPHLYAKTQGEGFICASIAGSSLREIIIGCSESPKLFLTYSHEILGNVLYVFTTAHDLISSAKCFSMYVEAGIATLLCKQCLQVILQVDILLIKIIKWFAISVCFFMLGVFFFFWLLFPLFPLFFQQDGTQSSLVRFPKFDAY